MSERAQGIEGTVYMVIKSNVGLHSVYITRPQINVEMAKTSFLSLKDEHYKSDTKSGETKFERAIDQSLAQLVKKGWIKKYGKSKKAKYTITTDDDKAKRQISRDDMYSPVVCKALRKEKGKSNYCPIANMYIGDPKSQCELLCGTDYTKLVETKYPMKTCYFDHKPKKGELEYARKKYKEREEIIKTQHDKLKALRGGL